MSGEGGGGGSAGGDSKRGGPAARRTGAAPAVAALTIAVLAVAVIGWAAWRQLGPAGDIGPIAEADAATIAAGRPLYERHCANCHGANLEGQPDWRSRRADGRLPAPPHDDSGHTWHHPDAVLVAITRHGLEPPYAPAGYRSDMPAFDGVLTDREIRAVLAWIASRWSPEIRAHQLRVTRGR